MKFVDALNAVHDNVWSLVIIFGGVGLMLRGHGSEGSVLVTLGAAVFQKKQEAAAKA